MKKSIRKTLFWICFVLFFLVCPLVILYSQGYRFDMYKNIFIHSGSVTIKSTPSSVNVFVDGKLQKSRSLDIINNSITIGGLRPGNYTLRLNADGYNDWEKKIEVHSGISTEFWNVFLIPKNTTPKSIHVQNVKRYFPSPFNEKVAFVSEKEGGTEIGYYDMKKDETFEIFSNSNAKFSEDESENAEWNIKEKLLLAPLVINGKKDYSVIDSEQKNEVLRISEIFSAGLIKKARWSPKDENGIYFLAKSPEKEISSLYYIDVDSKIPVLLAENIKTYDISSSNVYFLKENNVLYKADLEGKNEKQIINSPFDLDQENELNLVVYDDDRQALFSKVGNLYIHNNGKEDIMKKIEGTINSIQFSDDGKKLLFWGEYDISVIFLRDWNVQPLREENEIQQIIRFSSPVKNVFWYRDYEHVFFSNGGKVKLIELDSRDHRISQDVFDVGLDQFASSYDSFNGIFYYLNGDDKNKNIFYFEIPERKNFLGF